MDDSTRKARDHIEQNLTQLIEGAQKSADGPVSAGIQQAASTYLGALQDPHLTNANFQNAAFDFEIRMAAGDLKTRAAYAFFDQKNVDANGKTNIQVYNDIIQTSRDCASEHGLDPKQKVGIIERAREAIVDYMAPAAPSSPRMKP